MTAEEIKAAILFGSALGGGGSASSVSYDSTRSGLDADNVQDAVDELAEAQDVIDAGKLDKTGGYMSGGIKFNYHGAYILFNNSAVLSVYNADVEVGLRQRSMLLIGSDDRPKYRKNIDTPIELALLSDVDEKADKPTVKTAMDAVAVAGAQYYLGIQSAVSIVLPSDAEVGQQISVVFYSGDTAATLTISGTMLDVSYTPSANSRSEINALWDGTYWAVVTNEQAVTA